MLVTAAFSMFMSNTATAATLLAVVLPVATSLDRDDPFRVGIVLAIPVAANIGGIGTPVGTPPNAIAIGLLTDAGIEVSFGKWMLLAVPLMLVVLLMAWGLLLRLFPPRAERLRFRVEGSLSRRPDAFILYGAFAATVLLWLTEPLHGIPSPIVGFFPVVVLLATGVVGTRDLQSLPWHVLWLVAGGIALGLGVTTSGLDAWLIGRIDWGLLTAGVLAAAIALVALAVSTVISNSAAANLLIPIGLSLALSGEVGIQPVALAFFIAVGSSLAMALPVSTPPNAIAYSTGVITTRQMAAVGIVVGVAGWILYVVVGPWLWNLMGVSLS